MLKAVGFDDDDLAKPLIGVATTGSRRCPATSTSVSWPGRQEGIRDAGGTPIEFNTIAISDGVSMGTEGMRASWSRAR